MESLIKNKKIKLKKRILYKGKRLSNYTETKLFTYKDFKDILQEENITLQDDDIIYLNDFEESYDDGDSSRDSYISIKVFRYREETDEEFEKRQQKITNSKKEKRRREYQSYLKLKEKFQKEEERLDKIKKIQKQQKNNQ